ncbi:trypsin-1-like [Neocloeon triangulifer]|uniref:trypsin-1-like n=1 Tax=Neocloeon triangulifer TaxID=2078957 RepID=UPI00286F293F|nr:trypsin-1-like [Neocloeon triangulifer]
MELLLLITAFLNGVCCLQADETDLFENNHIEYFYDPSPAKSSTFLSKANYFVPPFGQPGAFGFNQQQPNNYFNNVQQYAQNSPDCVCGLPSTTTSGQRSPRANFFIEPDDGRIVGGIEAVPHSMPWMALLVSQERDYAPFCGGSIINDRYVLTAAHCYDKKILIEDIKIIIGEHDRCRQDRVTVIMSVDKMIIHPAFRQVDFFADIMLLRLSMRITFNRVIRPICLPPQGLSFENNWAIVSGWGTQNSSGSLQCTLKQATVPIISQQECALKSKYPPNAVHATLFCAGLIGQGGRDSCQASIQKQNF